MSRVAQVPTQFGAPATSDDPSPPWSSALAGAIGGAGVRLVAQPILAVEAASIAGYELLARMAGPPAAAPDVWFAAARDRGVAADLTCVVFDRLHRLRSTLPANTFCTVNVEPDLLLDPNVEAALHAGGDLDRVVVELTEHVPLGEDVSALLAVMDRVRAAGGTLAVDDAGTGYAGLTQLLALRPDLIKLDRALVAGIDTDPVRRALVEMVGALAGRMDAWLLAEGVETADELAVLAHLGVPLAQGWFIGRPAEPWAALDPDVAASIRRIAARAELRENVAPLVRSARTRRPDDRGSPALRHGDVLVDASGRPVDVAFAQVDRIVIAPAMVVAPSASPAEVLRRAMARPAAVRSIPIVCSDSAGRLIGVLEVADLVESVLAPGINGKNTNEGDRA